MLNEPLPIKVISTLKFVLPTLPALASLVVLFTMSRHGRARDAAHGAACGVSLTKCQRRRAEVKAT